MLLTAAEGGGRRGDGATGLRQLKVGTTAAICHQFSTNRHQLSANRHLLSTHRRRVSACHRQQLSVRWNVSVSKDSWLSS